MRLVRKRIAFTLLLIGGVELTLFSGIVVFVPELPHYGTLMRIFTMHDYYFGFPCSWFERDTFSKDAFMFDGFLVDVAFYALLLFAYSGMMYLVRERTHFRMVEQGLSVISDEDSHGRLGLYFSYYGTMPCLRRI